MNRVRYNKTFKYVRALGPPQGPKRLRLSGPFNPDVKLESISSAFHNHYDLECVHFWVETIYGKQDEHSQH